jgi:hypothetical protein
MSKKIIAMGIVKTSASLFRLRIGVISLFLLIIFFVF